MKQKFELDLELSSISQRDLDKIRRLCSDVRQPEEWLFLVRLYVFDLCPTRAAVWKTEPKL